MLAQCLIKFSLLGSPEMPVAMTTLQFTLLVFATIAIAAAGNVINDIYDVEIDKINRPNGRIVGKSISEKNAYRLYFILTIVGVLAGFVLANQLGHPGLAAIFVIVSAMLYVYAYQLKAILLIGNLLVSALVSFSLLVVLVFDIYPTIYDEIMPIQKDATRVVFHFAVFAFAINFLREIVKDIEDINGDKNGGINTLPIILGRERATTLVFLIGGLTLTSVLIYMYNHLYTSTLVLAYFMFLVAAPLLYFCIKAWSAKTKKEYRLLSNILKLVMLTGLSAMIFNELAQMI